eukprot:2036533-Pyramimonas_sp.AAC.1
MTSTGTRYLGGPLLGDYQLPSVAAPADSHARLPGKRAGPRFQRIQKFMVKALAVRMFIVLMRPPGYFRKLGPMRGAIDDLCLQVLRMRRCHVGL